VLSVGDLGELLGRVARSRDAHPFLGLRREALGRRQRDVLGRALGFRQQAVPQGARRGLEVLYVVYGVK
jgi:hypothetical protein